MTNLVIMPTENRERMNLGEFAEEATIIEETATPKRVNHFIEANTQEATLQHLKNDCITPVFAKDNELTVNHAAFIETVWEALLLGAVANAVSIPPGEYVRKNETQRN